MLAFPARAASIVKPRLDDAAPVEPEHCLSLALPPMIFLPEMSVAGLALLHDQVKHIHNERTATMSTHETEDTTRYKVVINHEEQYSIWPVDRDNPSGWRSVGKEGEKAECLAYIKEVWTDMRPLSLRKWMEASSEQKQAQ